MINIYHDSNSILHIECELGIINLFIDICFFTCTDSLFDYDKHYLWIKQAYGFYNPTYEESNHPYYFERLENSQKYKGKQLCLLPWGDWLWEDKDSLDSIPF